MGENVLQVNANLSKEIYEYYEGYNLSDVVATLLDMFDITQLPPVEGQRYKEVRLTISDPYYISLYRSLGPRNKKVSLARLLSYGYSVDVLSNTTKFVKILTKQDEISVSRAAVLRAYSYLSDARKAHSTQELIEIMRLVYKYAEVLGNARDESSVTE